MSLENAAALGNADTGKFLRISRRLADLPREIYVTREGYVLSANPASKSRCDLPHTPSCTLERHVSLRKSITVINLSAFSFFFF